MNVAERFDAFLSKIQLTPAQRADGTTKHTGVRACLNRHYYNSTSGTANSRLVGSWGKETQVRPPRDIDVLHVLPSEVYWRFEQRQGNKQAQLLQEVRDVLRGTYHDTDLRADGLVVQVRFESYAVELLPAFALQNSDRFWICDTNNGGQYKTVDPGAEQNAVAASNAATNGNTRALIRMLKVWQRVCTVPLKSFMLELLAVEFLNQWTYRTNSSWFYDWMVRDFLGWLVSTHQYSWSGVLVPGTNEYITLGNAWQTRAQSALDRAAKACNYEGAKMPCTAGGEWQKIFGDDIPSC
jgi:hypothetical protein